MRAGPSSAPAVAGAPGASRGAAAEYWSQRLPPTLEPSRLTAAAPGDGGDDHHEAQEVALTGDLLDRLRQVTGGGPFLLYTTLMAVLKICLARLTGTATVTVVSPPRREGGCPSPRAELLPIVDQVRSEMRVRDLLGAVRRSLLDAYTWQDYPVGRLLADRGWEGNGTSGKPFDVSLASEELHGEPARPLAEVDLVFSGGDDAVAGRIRYRRDHLEPTAAVRLARHLLTTLEGLLRDVDTRIGALPAMTAVERHQLTREWNDTTRDRPALELVHRVFERRVRHSPDSVAVAGEGTQLTGGELDRAAGRLAHRLTAAGVGAEAVVGLFFDRCPEALVAMLAVLKAGGAFLALDPEHPARRLAAVIEDAGMALLLTRCDLAPRLPRVRVRLFYAEEGEGGMEGPAAAEAAPDNLAYVIYTSGTTGAPKGVQLTHRGLCNLARAQRRLFHVQPGDRVVQLAAASFDASVSEIFMALLGSASLWLVQDPVALSGPALARFLAERAITTATLPPSTLASLPAGHPLPALATLVVAGESCPDRVVASWIGGRRFINAYGPTEATVCASAAVYDPRRWSCHIGRPIDNTRLQILDREMCPLPVGAPGELAIGGVGVARCYLGRPAATSLRFVPDPLSDPPVGRLYRSGDLARFRADGNLEFLGRADRQVKVRGFRIELEGVEAVLGAHPALRSVAVAVREDRSGSRLLAAYLVPRQPPAPPVGEIQGWLRRRLPDYMVPSVIVALDAMPLLPSGKPDRAALPAPEEVRPDLGSGRAVPRDPIEQVLAEIWAQVLEVDAVGVEDSFFELGGHSLRAVQVMSRISDAFDVELPLQALFEPPTVAGLARRVRRAVQKGHSVQLPPIEPLEDRDGAPLSFAQRRLWFLDRLDPGTALYNTPVSLRLEGSLRVHLLDRVLEEVLRRHQVLRTVYPESDGEPFQRITSPGRPLRLVDLTPVAPATRRQAALALARHEIGRPFDLERGPVLRALLIRLDPDEHYAVLTLHHIACDAWSLGVLVREVTALYEAARSDLPSPLPELPLQYADYAVWQRGWLEGEALTSLLHDWRRQLEGMPSALNLPTDRPRTSRPGGRGARRFHRLDAETSSRVRSLARRRGCTVFMVLLAVFETLLHRLSGQPDLAVGTPAANRGRVEIEPLIGFFVNTLVLPARLGGALPWERLLQQVRSACLQAFAHQELAFEVLVEALQPERDLHRSPLFQVMFAFDDPHTRTLELPGLHLSPLGIGNPTAQFDLTLTATDREGELLLSAELDTELLDATTVDRWLGHMRALLAAILADPSRPLATLPLFSTAERHQLLVEWNDATGEQAGGCLHRLFEGRAEQSPDAVAVEQEELHLSYGRLDREGSRLAANLRRRGVGAEVVVGLCLRRSPEAAGALLAVLKAGGAYLPLDPDLPEHRLAFMLEDAGPPLVLADEGFASRWTATASVARLSDLLENAPEAPVGWASDPGDADRLAYLIYTSGSTGRPKGVAVPHRGVVGWCRESARRYHLGPRDRVLQFASLRFDVAADELYPTWLAGATLVMRPQGALTSPDELASAVDRWRLTVVNLPTAYWQQWIRGLQELGRSLPPSLRLVVVGSEKVSRQALQLWRRLASGRVEWINAYGPTEASVGATLYRLHGTAETEGGGAEVPIGRPVSGVSLYLLDRGGEAVAPGVAGELHIGGAGLARGYLRRPSATAAVFVPDPFRGRRGARLYATGDRVRQRADGRLEFLGRTDQQVKIRGFRIEPGEIEAELERHPAVRQAVVAVAGGEAEARRLVAYLVADGAGAPGRRELRSFLARRLPAPMLPAVFVSLEAFPLTPAGKVDRRALPPPEPPGAVESQSYLSPVEEILAAIWAEILGVEGVAPADDFFELGGHSLLITHLLSRIRDAFGVELTVREVFDAPTPRTLAEQIEQRRGGRPTAVAGPIRRVPRDGALPLSFGQARLWFLDQLQPGGSTYNCPAGSHVRGPLEVALLMKAVSEIVRRHEILRTTFPDQRGRPVLAIHEARTLLLRFVDLSDLPGGAREAEARRLATVESRLPFDLARGPLLRLRLLRLAAAEHVVLFTMHHIISDGRSMEIFAREMGAIYPALHRGRPARLSEIEIQYADFAAWQRRWLDEAVVEKQLAYWRRQLAGPPPLLELPTDHPRPRVRRLCGERQTRQLGPELAEALEALSRRHRCTPFMTLLAAFEAALFRSSGEVDMVVGVGADNRNRTELEGLVGFFVNTLALRTDLGGDPTFLELLRRVRETCLEAFSHQDVPFERVVEELQPERSAGEVPFFRVMFAYKQGGDEVTLGEDLELSPFRVETGTAKLDLILSVTAYRHGLGVNIEYDTDLFEPETVQLLLRRFEDLLAAIVENPDRPIAELPWDGATPTPESPSAPELSHHAGDAAQEFSFQR